MSTLTVISKNTMAARPARTQSLPKTDFINTIPELVLIRGLPGSGKSTMGKTFSLIGYVHFEADQFFMRDGIYQYDATKIRDAHEWCQAQARAALAAGKHVVVCNTFVWVRELHPYITMTPNTRILTAEGHWGNIHGVSQEQLARMTERWEHLPCL